MGKSSLNMPWPLEVRGNHNMAYRTHLMICTGTACVSSGSFDIKKELEQEIRKHGLENEILVVTTGCQGFCAQGPR